MKAEGWKGWLKSLNGYILHPVTRREPSIIQESFEYVFEISQQVLKKKS